MNDDQTFTLPALNAELEKVWIELHRERSHAQQFQRNITAASTLTTLSVIMLAIALLIVVAILRKENAHHGGA
jgi:hypothetical protein